MFNLNAYVKLKWHFLQYLKNGLYPTADAQEKE